MHEGVCFFSFLACACYATVKRTVWVYLFIPLFLSRYLQRASLTDRRLQSHRPPLKVTMTHSPPTAFSLSLPPSPSNCSSRNNKAKPWPPLFNFWGFNYSKEVIALHSHLKLTRYPHTRTDVLWVLFSLYLRFLSNIVTLCVRQINCVCLRNRYMHNVCVCVCCVIICSCRYLERWRKPRYETGINLGLAH